MSQAVIKMHPADNVAVVVSEGGLAAGTEVAGGVILRENIPQAHKVALKNFAQGDTDAFAAEAAALDAAEGDVFGAEIGAFIDHHAADAEFAGEALEDGVIVAEDAGLQAVNRVVDSFDRLAE